ncbi:MAG: YHS domain-containing protein [Candidatus Altiarchaeota archaeon]|nr:YHS domain-containing protein [Candidatus Altiarchaeota archaeon]
MAESKCPKCPVCETEIHERTAQYVTDHEGQRYYFCSPDCKREFSKGPAKYVRD